jgi:uncharacterized repeat protein (TIGR01451 family)
MFSSSTNRYYKKTTVATMLLVIFSISISVAFADKHSNQITKVISSFGKQNLVKNVLLSTPNSSVTLDFSLATGESWDAIGSSNNVVLNCFNGKSITAFEYTNITIQTEGSSFFSEAIMYFSSSANEDDGLNAIKLKVGTDNETSGTASFNSPGILDLTDSGQPDIFSLSDNKFNLQFYEHIDDVVDAIDARFINGKLKVHGVDLTANENCPFIKGTTNSTPLADLSVSHTAEISGENQIGSNLEYVVNVLNNSPDYSATNVRISSVLSSNLNFTQATCDNGTNTMVANDIASLAVGDIAANATLQCTLTAEITEVGEYTNNLTILSDNDPDVNNNAAIIVIINGPAAAIAVPINNLLTLLILMFALIYSAKRIKKT